MSRTQVRLSTISNSQEAFATMLPMYTRASSRAHAELFEQPKLALGIQFAYPENKLLTAWSSRHVHIMFYAMP
eukprot:8344335-Pyramimonas_sp.AAC.1